MTDRQTAPAPRRLRVGILGTGGISDAHAAVLHSLPDVDLAAACDLDVGRAREFAARWGAPAAFASVDAMLGEAGLDVVHVLLPPRLHSRFAIRCIEAGADVFVEKPLCVSASECRDLEEVASVYRRKIGVNHNLTFHPAFLAVVSAIRRSRIGAVESVTVHYSVPYGVRALDSSWRLEAGPGVVVLETGPHPVSLIMRLLGEAKQAVALPSAQIRTLGDTWQIAMECERGVAQCYLAIGRGATDTSIHVIGEDGQAFANLALNCFALTENTRFSPRFSDPADTLGLARQLAGSAVTNFRGWVRNVLTGRNTDLAATMMAGSIAAFYEALRSGGAPPVGMDEGLAVVRSCLRVIEAGGKGQDRSRGLCTAQTTS